MCGARFIWGNPYFDIAYNWNKCILYIDNIHNELNYIILIKPEGKVVLSTLLIYLFATVANKYVEYATCKYHGFSRREVFSYKLSIPDVSK